MKSPGSQVSGMLVPALVVTAVAMRLIPHPVNFLPITAMALFAGARCAGRMPALALIGATMLLSDAVLGFHQTMFFVYGSLAATVLLGSLLRGREGVVTIGASALASSLLFFVVTNFGVWLTEALYPLTLAGLTACYVAAIPFFENSLAADLFYSAVLFGVYELASRRLAPAPCAA